MNCESEFDRLVARISELEMRETVLLLSPAPEAKAELANARERTAECRRELEHLWQRRTNACCGNE
jgi:hypothetical protein